jgi:dTMP kinase
MQISGLCAPLQARVSPFPLSYPVSVIGAHPQGAEEAFCCFMVTFPAMVSPQFVTFEGLDGSGKSTHLRRVSAWFTERGIPHLVTHEPGGTPLGDALRALFLDPRWGAVDGVVELFLVFASRRQHLLEVIEPALAAGRHVLCDRFTDSTRAYQGWGRGVPLDVIDQVDRLATGGRTPDRTLLFDLPADKARARGHSPTRQERGTADRLDAEALDFYERVRRGFLAMSEGDPRFRVISSAGSFQATEERVREALADLLQTGGLEGA